MISKRSIIVALAGLNLSLLAAVFVSSYSLPPAYAQVKARAGDFVCVTAKPAIQTYDVLYVLDVPGRKLYGFYPTSANKKQLTSCPPRDLVKDFERK